ncbi:MAG: hypothetical protein Q7J59_02695 [Elusimicrobiota bacterium]|nr:hypothetical protein [Elusimicrobiota bacterium]
MPKSKMKNKRVGYLSFDFITKKFIFYISYRDKKGALRHRDVKGKFGPRIAYLLHQYGVIENNLKKQGV